MRANGEAWTHAQKTVPSERTLSGGSPPRSSTGELAPGGPRAAFEHARERQARKRQARRAPTRARSSSSDTVSARHSTTISLPTSQTVARSASLIELQHAGVEQQAAVAVFGQRGQRVAVDDRVARPFERLEQRIREPLRQLVERHEACRRTVAARVRMAPHVAGMRVAHSSPCPGFARQIGPKPSRMRTQDRGADSVRVAEQRIEQRARDATSVRSGPAAFRACRRAVAAARRGRRGRPADCRHSPGTSAPSVAASMSVSAAASTRIGSPGDAENAPAMKRAELATPRPSERA